MLRQILSTIRQKNSQAIILDLRDNQGRSFTKEDLGKICLEFYQDLYKYKAISGEAMQEVLEGLLAIFIGTHECIIVKSNYR